MMRDSANLSEHSYACCRCRVLARQNLSSLEAFDETAVRSGSVSNGLLGGNPLLSVLLMSVPVHLCTLAVGPLIIV